MVIHSTSSLLPFSTSSTSFLPPYLRASTSPLISPSFPPCHFSLRSNLYVCWDQHSDALPSLETCLMARNRLLGADHTDTLATVELLNSAYEALGTYP